jgi:hypothetical protein
MKHSACLLLAFAIAPLVHAQSSESLNPPASSPAAPAAPRPPAASQPSSSPLAGDSSFLGRDIPVLNPGSDTVIWDGKAWNVQDNRLFRARFEKYLNAPEETAREDLDYNELLETISALLAPGQAQLSHDKQRDKRNLDVAFELLAKASRFQRDAKLCDSIAMAVYNVWNSRKETAQLERHNKLLEEQRRIHEWNLEFAARGDRLSSTGNSGGSNSQSNLERDIRMTPTTKRLTQVEAEIAANKLKKEATDVLAKLQFQSLIFQLFAQRRFQHAVIGSRFYRALFNDGNVSIQLGEDTKQAFSRISGGPPTLEVLDSLANEAIRDVREGVQAFEFLLENNEMASASQRLAEAFIVGEYLPEIRTLARTKKRQTLEFTQKSNKLLSSLEVRDYTEAEKLISEMKTVARDFDESKPMALIETARTTSRLHLAKAKVAAGKGDMAAFETELKQAAEIWPRNPELAEMSGLIFSRSDEQTQALSHLNTLLQNKDYWGIEKDAGRFLAVSYQNPEKQAQVQEALRVVTEIKATIMKAEEIAKRGDLAGAWETVESVFSQYPDDNRLNQLRARYTTEASEFVRSLSEARKHEDREQYGSSLAWYLKAQRIYPPSDFARQGIDRVSRKIIPES